MKKRDAISPSHQAGDGPVARGGSAGSQGSLLLLYIIILLSPTSSSNISDRVSNFLHLRHRFHMKSSMLLIPFLRSYTSILIDSFS